MKIVFSPLLQWMALALYIGGKISRTADSNVLPICYFMRVEGTYHFLGVKAHRRNMLRFMKFNNVVDGSITFEAYIYC